MDVNIYILETLKVLFYTSFVWFPALLIFAIWEIWLIYKRSIWLSDSNPKEAKRSILLEIKAPKDVFKSPKAMEFFINGLYKTDDEDTNYNIYWNGQLRPNFSLEIVSIDGTVHFYVRCPRWLKPPIESNLYSQYPGIEVFEVPDYTLPVKYDPDTQGLWGTEFKLRKEDVFPIKTYVDFGMDKDPKEELKIDPLTPFIEYIGQWGRGHQMWLQILVRAHKNEHPDPTDPKKDLRWGEEAKKQVEKIINEARGEHDKDKKLIPGTSRLTTEDEKQTIEAIARKQSKNAYDVGMRFIYTAPKDVFVVSNLTGAVGALMNFSHASNLNGLSTDRATGSKHVKTIYEFWPFSLKKKKDVNDEKKAILDAYKHRGYFYNEYKQPYFILNSEELATLFHLPGQVSSTPTYERIEAKKAEAPANLPV